MADFIARLERELVAAVARRAASRATASHPYDSARPDRIGAFEFRDNAWTWSETTLQEGGWDPARPAMRRTCSRFATRSWGNAVGGSTASSGCAVIPARPVVERDCPWMPSIPATR